MEVGETEVAVLLVVALVLVWWFNGCSPRKDKFQLILDRFTRIEDVKKELRRAGLEDCNLIVAIDATRSNEFQGEVSFGGRSLHAIDPRASWIPVDEDPGGGGPPMSNMAREAAAGGGPPVLNPYERVLATVCRTLGEFDEDGIIPSFVFGDILTKGSSVRPLRRDGRPCVGLDGVLEAYREEARRFVMSGPTSFAPAIDKAVEIVKASGGGFHVLLIIADGQVASEAATIEAVRRASHYPLAIIVCGVGDGPWDTLRTLDDRVTGRLFDNLQSVFFHEIETRARHPDAAFALATLMEVPDQFKACRELGLIGKTE